jgi:hypothetical protein
LPLVVVRKRPTLTSFHPTPPGSPSLLQVSINSEEVQPSPDKATSTSIGLIGFKEPYQTTCPRTTDQIIQKLVEHFLLIFLEAGCPRVTVIDHGLTHSVNEVFDKEFRTTAAVHEFAFKGIAFTLHGLFSTSWRGLSPLGKVTRGNGPWASSGLSCSAA